MISPTIRKKAIESQIKALRDFGYPDADKDNIFDGSILTMFFESALQDALNDPACVKGDTRDTLMELLKEVQTKLGKK